MTAGKWYPVSVRGDGTPTALRLELTPDCKLELRHDCEAGEDVLLLSLDLGRYLYDRHFTMANKGHRPLSGATDWAERCAREVLRGISVTVQVALDRLETET